VLTSASLAYYLCTLTDVYLSSHLPNKRKRFVSVSFLLFFFSLLVEVGLRDLNVHMYFTQPENTKPQAGVCSFIRPLAFLFTSCCSFMDFLWYLRLGKSHSKHAKFLRYMRNKHKRCVPPIVISAHQFTMLSHHQDAAREYLEAYKLMPECPLINLCAGKAFFYFCLTICLYLRYY
jgi:hypothetical protein